MNSYAVSGFINALTVSILGLTVYLKGRKNITNIKYSLFCFFVAVWSFNYFIWQISDNEANALFYSRGLMAGAIFIPVCFLDFVVTLIGLRERRKVIVNLGYVIFFIFFLTNFTPYFIKGVSPKLGFPYWPEPGILFTPFLILWLIYCIYPCYLLFRGYRRATGLKRNQIKYVLLGIIIGYASGSTNYFLWYDIPIPPVGNYIVPLFVATMAFSIIRYRLMDINIAIKKVITNLILTIVIVMGVMAIAILPITLRWIISFVLGVVITTYLPRLKIKTESTINHILYKEKYKYQEDLENFIDEIPHIPGEEDLFTRTAKILSGTLGVKKVSIFILDHVHGDYYLRTQIGLDGNREFRIPSNIEITCWLKEHKEVFIKEEMEKLLVHSELDPIKETLDKLDATVCVPSMSKDDLVGFITLGEKTSGEMYSHIDTRILNRLGTLFAMVLNSKQMEAKLMEQKALGYIMLMSKEMSHQLRNRLVATQTYFQMLPERQNDPAFAEQFTKVVLADVNALTYKISELTFFANLEKPRPKYSVIDIIIKAALLLVQKRVKEKNIEIHREEEKNLPQIFVDEELITSSISNFLDNAAGAVPETGGKTDISVSMLHDITKEMKQKSAQWIRIVIKDNGCGMRKETIDNIFKPFFTTRSGGEEALKMGFGLGLVTSKMIIEAHGGNVRIDSEENKGTTAIIDLPVANRELLEGDYLPPEGVAYGKT